MGYLPEHCTHVVFVGWCYNNITLRCRRHILMLDTASKQLLLQERNAIAPVAIGMEREAYTRHGEELLAHFREPALVFLSSIHHFAGTVNVTGELHGKHFQAMAEWSGGVVVRRLTADVPLNILEEQILAQAIALVAGGEAVSEKGLQAQS